MIVARHVSEKVRSESCNTISPISRPIDKSTLVHDASKFYLKCRPTFRYVGYRFYRFM